MKKFIKRRVAIWILCVFMLIVLGILVGIEVRYKELLKSQTLTIEALGEREYKYHCAFIAEDYEDPYLNSIYEGAKEEGEKQDIYVENYGEKLSLHYTVDERIEMAIAANVDAIVLEGNDEVGTTDLINTAIDQKIAVVTVYQDQVQSRRRSFIGVNKFMMGYSLCEKAYGCLENDDDEIMVLYDKNSNVNPENTILNSGLKKFLTDHASSARLNAEIIDSTETYNTEEEIRELLRNVSARPRVLVCTNLIQTQCAYQTIVDLNCVGDVKILGFYATQSLLEAIDKGVIEATLMVDTYQMGTKAVDNVAEFLEVGYVSDYVAVDTHIIDKKEAGKLIEANNKEETTMGGDE
ncbi:MAG: sugar ABC transporter substrate-binding protein [Velocimicrobium sp.]